MKRRVPLLTVPLLAMAVSPALAQQELYDNGPINGTTNGWDIARAGRADVSNVTVMKVLDKTSPLLWDEVSFGVWEFQGDVMTSVDWSVTSLENGGIVYASGTASGANLTDQFISTNQYAYDIDKITVSGLNVDLQAGGAYWLNLQNAQTPSGDPVYWDENSGVGCGGNDGKGGGCPSQASDSTVGTIPSEAFTIYGTIEASTPEPSSLMLFVSGILSLAGMLRRKLF